MTSTATFDFSDSTVIVTGAGRGIGLALSRAFLSNGAHVVMVDADAETLGRAAERLGGHAVGADVTSTTDVECVVNKAIERTGRIDVLINNAGHYSRQRPLEDPGQRLGCRRRREPQGHVPVHARVRASFRAQGGGRVINVTSFTGLRGNTGQAAYAAAKSGVIGFTKTAAKELSRFGITVNAISPNAQTRMIESVPPEKLADLEALIPLGRFADPAEIAGGVMFLASDQAAYITGVVLPIDGGVSM